MARLLRLKHAILRTPLEEPAKRLQRVGKLIRRLRHPELLELTQEDARVETGLRRLLRRDWTCIDVGAHIGSMLSLMIRLAPGGKHIAFEPTPEKAQWLRKKFPEAVYQIALGERPGWATFYENLSRAGFSSLAPPKRKLDRSVAYQVRVETLDAILPSDYRPDFIKVDVEGAEIMVLRGARQAIQRCRPTLLFECAHDGPPRFGSSPVELFRFVAAELGYGVYTPRRFLEHGAPLSEDEFAAAQIYPFSAFNFFATPMS